MSRRTLLWIIGGVVLVHLGLFFYFGRLRALPKVKYQPPANFGYSEAVYENTTTGERTVYREIRVSTKLADPSKLPPPPDYSKERAGVATPAPADKPME